MAAVVIVLTLMTVLKNMAALAPTSHWVACLPQRVSAGLCRRQVCNIMQCRWQWNVGFAVKLGVLNRKIQLIDLHHNFARCTSCGSPLHV